MNILHVIDHLETGGAQSLVVELLNNSNHSLFVLRNSVDYKNIKVDQLYISSSRSRFSLLPLLQLYKEIKNRKINVLHCHLAKSKFFGLILKLLLPQNFYLFFHEHGEIIGTDAKKSGGNFFYRTLILKSKNKVSNYFCVSTESLIELTKIIGVKSICHLFYNPAKTPPQSNTFKDYSFIESRTNLSSDNYTFIFGFIGRLIQRKGCYDMVLSFSKVFANRKNIKLVIAGNGSELDRIKSKVTELDLQEQIFLLKALPYEDISSFYSGIDCLIIPSYWEGNPLTMMEGVMHRIPIVATVQTNAKELFEEGKDMLLYNCEDTALLEKYLELIISNENLRNTLTQNSFEKIKPFAIQKYIERLEAIYQKIL